MGLMTFMRTKMGYFLVGGIAVVLALFVLEPLLQQGSVLFGASATDVGSIDGKRIKYEEFNKKVEQSSAQFSQQYGGSLNPQMQAMAVDQAWQSEIAKTLLEKEYNRIGLTVSGDELFDLVQGKKPSPLIVQYFGNPKTGQIDRPAILSSRKSNDADVQKQWLLLEQEIERQALQQKYAKLISNSIYVTSLEANDEHINRNKLVNFKYVMLDYASLADKGLKITDDDYQDYYNANKNRFVNQQEQRNLDYVSFSIKPTVKDSAAIKATVEKLAADFKTAANDSLFAASNSDHKVPYAWLTKGKLDYNIDSIAFSLPAGSFYGPVLLGNSYKLFKVVAARFSPDSVKASHILIDPGKVGGLEAAKKMADSLKAVAQNGGNFAELAAKYSVDGSKDKGGELGTFGRGTMVTEFENAAFDGKSGEINVAVSQFGIHVVKIEKQIGSSKVIKLAYIEKNLEPSQSTRDAAYKKASTFLNEVNSKNFNSLAEKRGYTIASAGRLTATQGFAAGLDNPRPIIKAAYEADKGDVLPEIYGMNDAFVVAKLTEIRPKGQLSLADVKKEIQSDVINAVKAKLLIEKFEKAGKGSLEAIAQKVGKQVVPVQNIVFANPVIPGLAQENAVVGNAFGSQTGKVSKPIKGERGVYVISVDGFTNPAQQTNIMQQKKSMALMLGQRSLETAFRAMQDKANIKDNRVKFY